MSRKIFIIIATIAVLLMVGATIASAHGGRGNGRGNNPGPNPNPMPGDNCCMYDPSMSGNMQGNQFGGQGYRGQGGFGGNGGMGGGYLMNLPPATPGELPSDVIAALEDGFLDEQHALAVYGAIIDQLGVVRPFSQIQMAEAQHASALEFLFDRYGVPTPTIPEFELPTVTSLEEACQLAADAEIANFDMYDNILAAVADYPDLVQVFTALRDASEFNHLPAFEACAN